MEHLWFYEATVGTPCLAFVSEIWDACCELFYVSERELLIVLSFIKVKHNDEMIFFPIANENLDLTSSVIS